ncbi:MAG: hypothetical protein SVU24_06260 [Pseudomonadota bacterium]|jgi:hypothetical protein|nr:hypothetical protein [Pseudomonadota bacterium]
MNAMTGFDWIVLAGLVLLVSVWLVRRIRASLGARGCSSEPSGCAGCSGGCRSAQRRQAAARCPPTEQKKPGRSGRAARR